MRKKKFFDNSLNLLRLYFQNITKLVQSKFKKNEQNSAKYCLVLQTATLNHYDPIINEDLVRENELCTEYNKAHCFSKSMYDGEEKHKPAWSPFMLSTDRAKRKEANEVKWKYYADNAEQLDRIFDDLVKIKIQWLKNSIQKFC